MKYLSAALLVLALSGCVSNHELTSCKGPYSAITPPPIAPAKVIAKGGPV